jgi:hypothetical protein
MVGRTGPRPFKSDIGSGPGKRQPAAFNRQFEPGQVLGGTGLQFEQQLLVDQLDINAVVLHRLDRISDLDQLAGGLLRVGIGAGDGEFRLAAARLRFIERPSLVARLRIDFGDRCI